MKGELAITERDGEYTKQPNEDVTSIAEGITGWKGRVHLHFANHFLRCQIILKS